MVACFGGLLLAGSLAWPVAVITPIPDVLSLSVPPILGCFLHSLWYVVGLLWFGGSILPAQLCRRCSGGPQACHLLRLYLALSLFVMYNLYPLPTPSAGLEMAAATVCNSWWRAQQPLAGSSGGGGSAQPFYFPEMRTYPLPCCSLL